jgi:hypothetical protein
MKALPVALLFAAVGQAFFLQPQASPAQSLSDILGFLGITSVKLANLDLSIYAPILKPFLPVANAFSDSGALAKYANTIVPDLKLVDRIDLAPKLRTTSKRAKVRLGPFPLTGKGASISIPLVSDSIELTE